MMTDFLKWLSINPLAFVFFNLIITVIVSSIVARGFETTDELSLWPFRFVLRLKPPRPLVQIGEVDLPDGSAKDALRGNQQGIRGVYKYVKFDPAFKRTPTVTVSLRLIDVGDVSAVKINRLRVSPAHVSRKGFDIHFETWEDSKVWDVSATWIAVAE